MQIIMMRHIGELQLETSDIFHKSDYNIKITIENNKNNII